MKSPNFFHIVILLIAGVLPSCSDNNVTSTHPISTEDKPGHNAPVLKLQRIFKQVSMQSVVLMLQAKGEDNVWYIVEKAGRVLRVDVAQDDSTASVFLDITDRVNAGPNEAGLLGMAFHPRFAQNRQVYISYTASDASLVSRISRFESRDNGKTLAPDSEKIVLQLQQPYSNHNGGNIMFGPDGYLYIGFGDGGAGGDPEGNGQNTQTLLGALLRIDVNKGDPYAIPPDNPFAGNPRGRPEIYAWGLRNPWRWSFDRNTGVIWLADVGQNNWEEVNVVTQPGNYGWNGKEGTHCYNAKSCDNPDYIDPVLEYSHEHGCSITGGYVYRGVKIPDLQGTYLYADYCSGTVWGARTKGNEVAEAGRLIDSGLNIASFAQGNDGELYLVHLGGEIYRIVGQ